MGQSLVQNYIHIVFSTKYRREMIFPPFEKELYAYIGATCKELECPVIIVGGYRNHVHILCRLTQKLPLMTLVQKVKNRSSKWFKTKDKILSDFYWQDGYGAFSVNPSQVDIVRKYIENQEAYHQQKSFETEYRSFLKKYKVEYDEKYVWD